MHDVRRTLRLISPGPRWRPGIGERAKPAPERRLRHPGGVPPRLEGALGLRGPRPRIAWVLETPGAVRPPSVSSACSKAPWFAGFTHRSLAAVLRPCVLRCEREASAGLRPLRREERWPRDRARRPRESGAGPGAPGDDARQGAPLTPPPGGPRAVPGGTLGATHVSGRFPDPVRAQPRCSLLLGSSLLSGSASGVSPAPPRLPLCLAGKPLPWGDRGQSPPPAHRRGR